MSSTVRQRRFNLSTWVKAGTLFFAVMLASAASPASASAISIPGVDQVTGAIGSAIGSVGGGILKDALQWLFGGFQADITAGLIKFLTRIELPTSGSLSAVTGPLIVIGGFFLVVGLITSVGDGYREVIAGTDTAPRVIGQAIFRAIGLALLLGSWFWLVPLAVDVANGMSSYVLSDHAVHEALRRSFVVHEIGLDGGPIVWVLIMLAMAMIMVILVVLKFIMVILFACLYVGGPVGIGMGALPRIGPMFVGVVLRALVTLMIIPLVWTIVFAAWAGVGAGTLEAVTHVKLMRVLAGPGLFIAGAVVLLAITRRLFAMATAGMRMSMPGAGIARAAITMAIGRAMGAKMIDATSTIGKEKAVPQPTPGDAAHQRSERSGGINPVGAAPEHFRKLPDTPAGREQDRGTREARRGEMDRAHGDFRDDATPRRRRDAPEKAVEEMRSEFTERLRAGFEGNAPAEDLNMIGNQLPRGDRAGIAKMAVLARQQHPNDPAMANQLFRRDLAQQYAGRNMMPDEHRAILTAGAAGTEGVMEAWGQQDLAHFDQPLWATVQGRHGMPGTIKLDEDPFTPGGRARMKNEYDRRKRSERDNPPGG